MVESFAWREIGRVRAGPRLRPPDERSHFHSPRTLTPPVRRLLPEMSYRERAMMVGIGV
jgi:hypothetical protein